MLVILLYSEISWVVLYCCIVIYGIINDDSILMATSFLVMALAGLEFCVGFILSIFFRNFKKSFGLFNSLLNNIETGIRVSLA